MQVAHCQAMVTGISLWDVRIEPAMGSVMDFGPRAGDWTLSLSSVSYNWNFVTSAFPNLSTWHIQTMIKETLSRYLLSLLQLHLQEKYTRVHLLQLVWCSRPSL